MFETEVMLFLHVVIVGGVLIRVLLRPHRDPSSRIAWIAVVGALPVAGVIAYLLFGEVNIGRYRSARTTETINRLLPLVEADAQAAREANLDAQIAPRFDSLFRMGRTISICSPVGGNSGRLMADSNASIDSIVADIDTAEDHVHLLFYIWLDDGNGRKVIEALKRAAARGVTCRAMVDDLGSRALVKSRHWKELAEAGVKTAVTLPIGSLVLRPLRGRFDLRDHRKIVVIDGKITYCGSQNCADPEFRVKPKFAPWVDAVIRFEGPIARQNNLLFARDWMTHTDEDLTELLRRPLASSAPGFPALVVATGPTGLSSAMTEMFEALIHTARDKLVISTPYYVPGESLQRALCAAGRRKVDTTIIFPAHNDSWMVAGASRSCYLDLLESGVRINEYVGGLLHTKSLTLDGEVTLIGSANMDRRSFDLNYENNILFHDRDLTAEVLQRQEEYMAKSNDVTQDVVAAWAWPRRLVHNMLGMLAPLI